MRVTGHAQHEAWQRKQLPPLEEVRPGLWSVAVPIPDNPLRYTLTYLVATDSELVVVDPGWDTDAGWTALTGALDELGVALGDVSGVVVTHVHPDHHGLSARLREASGAWVAMHPAERDSLPGHRSDAGEASRTDAGWLRRCGVPEDVASQLRVRPEAMAPFLAMARPDVLLHDGDYVPLRRSLRAVWTPGHTPGHLCLHLEDEDLLLTGDHVLPRISPNIGLQPHDADPPLAAYLASLERIAGYPDVEVLPAHEYRFTGLPDRVRTLLRHHENRCTEVLGTLDRLGKPTVWEVTQELSWSRGWGAVTGFMRRAAVAETAAHLQYLRDLGRVTEHRDGGQEPLRYSAARSTR